MNSSSSRCTCSGGPSPGAATVSIAVSPPPLWSLVALNVRTPPTGLSTDTPSPGTSANGRIANRGVHDIACRSDSEGRVARYPVIERGHGADQRRDVGEGDGARAREADEVLEVAIREG